MSFKQIIGFTGRNYRPVFCPNYLMSLAVNLANYLVKQERGKKVFVICEFLSQNGNAHCKSKVIQKRRPRRMWIFVTGKRK